MKDEFYPTPEPLAREMLLSLTDKSRFGFYAFSGLEIIEPSAGSGSIVAAAEDLAGVRRYNEEGCQRTGRHYHSGSSPKDKNLSLDCIELNPDLRAILKSKGLHVVHDDFLTFRPGKKYNAVVMNPPFSAGAAHLLKAIDLLADGGKIRCILNAETIRNPYTNERKLLLQKLQALNAKIEYRENAFSKADRKTNVEIALVYVDIPKREPISKIRLELRRETLEELKANPTFAALVSSDPIRAAIQRYNTACKGLRALYEEFEGISSLLSPTGEENPVVSLSDSYNGAVKKLRKMYWKQLFDIPQIRDNLTSAMRNDYATRIEELAAYDFSEYNILTLRQEISANLIKGVENEAIALFDDWTNLNYSDYSKNIHYFNGWCTNSAYKVNSKVIFRCNAYDNIFNKFYHTHWDVSEKLHSIEMTLYHLDTNGKAYDGEALRAALKEAEEKQLTTAHLRYFDVTFYKKGTAHVVFTNQDVLKAFNAFACQKKGWLPPSYGKKAYRDMTSAEQKAVDSFEGESSYTDTLSRGLLPSSATLLQITGGKEK